MKYVILIGVLLATSLMSNTWAGQCESPSDYVHKVFSADGKNIEYELDSSIDYKNIVVQFFGKRDHVKRRNAIVKLNSPKGTFSVPETVFIPPAQLWFNFVITDSSGCKQWGLVNQVPIYAKNNLIGIDNPSGEGDAFFLKLFLKQ